MQTIRSPRTLRRCALLMTLALVLAACQIPISGTFTQVTSGNAYPLGVSDDGTYVLFEEVGGGQAELGERRLVLKNMTTGTKTGINAVSPGSGRAFLSRDGRYVVFETSYNPVTAVKGWYKVYRWDRTTGVSTVIASEPSSDVRLQAASANGTYAGVNAGFDLVVLVNAATKSRLPVVGTATEFATMCGISDDGQSLLYTKDWIMRLYDRSTLTTVRSWDLYPAGLNTRWDGCGKLSADGGTIVFGGNSAALPGGRAPDWHTWLYTWTRSNGTVRLISKAVRESQYDYYVSSTGRYVLFGAYLDSGSNQGFRFDQSTGSLIQCTKATAFSFGMMGFVAAAGGGAAVYGDGFSTLLVYRWRQ